jgi:hypothetical protein
MPTTAAFLGIVMLDTRFPRPPGDIGNPVTFERAGIPARFKTVLGASPQRVVREADPALLKPFIEAAASLVEEGARMISTSCGFLAAYQAQMSAAVRVPVITSSLVQCVRFRRPGIVTFDASALGASVLEAAGVPPGTPIEAVEPSTEFYRKILGNEATLDLVEAEKTVVDAALRLVSKHPDVEDIVLECTNMPPYRAAVANATGRKVHDLETLLIGEWGTCAAPQRVA